MAAPDFPASPTVGQTYTAPSGLVYTWDGAVWANSGAAQSAYWTDTGTTLQPTVATRTVTSRGDAQGNAFVAGAYPSKARLFSSPTSAQAILVENASLGASQWVLDNTAKPGWLIQMNSDTDNFSVQHTPATAGVPAWPAMLQIDNAGNLTETGWIKGHAYGCAGGFAGVGVNAGSVNQPLSFTGVYYDPYNLTGAGNQVIFPNNLLVYLTASVIVTQGNGQFNIAQYNGSAWVVKAVQSYTATAVGVNYCVSYVADTRNGTNFYFGFTNNSASNATLTTPNAFGAFVIGSTP